MNKFYYFIWYYSIFLIEDWSLIIYSNVVIVNLDSASHEQIIVQFFRNTNTKSSNYSMTNIVFESNSCYKWFTLLWAYLNFVIDA